MNIDKELEETMATNSEWKGSSDKMWERVENQIQDRQQRRKWYVPVWGAVAAAALVAVLIGAYTMIPGSNPVPPGMEPGAPNGITPGMTSSVPPGTDEAILASYPPQVQAAVRESKHQEGARAVTVGDDLWIIITAGNQPGAAVPVSAEQKNGTVEVVYSIQPLTGVVSSTGLNPEPYNVLEVKGAGKAEVTFRKDER